MTTSHWDGHIIFFSAVGWSLHHPAECGTDEDAKTCEINKAAQKQIIYPTEEPGQYKVRLEDGVLKYERA